MTAPSRIAPAALAWLRRRHVGVQVVVWFLLWWSLLPLLAVARWPDSRPVRWGAAAWVALVVLGALVSEPAPSPPTADTDVAAASDEEATRDESPPPATSPAPVASPSAPGVVASADVSPAASPAPSPAPSPSPTVATSAGPRGDDAPVVVTSRVVDIVDGDTIDLHDGTRVRLAIVDTPEVHGGIEPCGPEASDLTGAFLAGQTVAVYRPAGAPRTDRSGRVVGEVVRVSDGASLNVALVAAGLGRIDDRFTAEDPDLTRRLRTAAERAERPACEERSAAAPPPASDADPGGAHTGRTDGGWTCHPAYRECLPQVDDLDCGDIGHAVALLGDADPYRLDGRSTSREDGDGCESYGAWSAGATYPYY